MGDAGPARGAAVLDDDDSLEPDGLHIRRDSDSCHMHFLIIIVMSVEQQMTSYKLTIEVAHNVIS